MSAVAVLLLSLTCVRSNPAGKVGAGDSLPDFTLESEVYGTLSTADMKGKVVYLCLFATWCPSCLQELDAMQETMLPEFSEEEDFMIVAIGREHTDAELQEFNGTRGLGFPLYPDPDRSVYSLFADETIPRTYVVDRDGVIVDAATGYEPEHFQTVIDTIRDLIQ